MRPSPFKEKYYVHTYCPARCRRTGTELSEEDRKMWDYYEQEVLKAIESDTWTEMTPEYWSEFLRKREDRKAARQAERKS